jgi:hypothetical protein
VVGGDDGRVEQNLRPGTPVHGVVIGHRPWGLEVNLGSGVGVATVDLRFIDDEPIVFGDKTRWPAVGARVHGTFQGVTPNGQRRVSLRLSDAPAP